MVRVTQMPIKAADEIAQDKAEWREKVSTDNWTIRLTCITAVILGFQLVAFGLQAHRLNQSIKEAKRATEATLIAARAAEQTVVTMNLTARRDLRAYVAIANSSIEHLDEEGHPRAKLTIKNFGKTFRARYGLTPTEYRKQNQVPESPETPAARVNATGWGQLSESGSRTAQGRSASPAR